MKGRSPETENSKHLDILAGGQPQGYLWGDGRGTQTLVFFSQQWVEIVQSGLGPSSRD